MARVARNEAIYRVAEEFRQRCLIGDTSLLWPNQRAWTTENLRIFWTAFVGHPDEGKDPFIIKWSRQLDGEPDEVIQIATDIAALYGLFPVQSSFGSASKKKLVDDVRDFRPGMDDPNEEVKARLHAAFDREGIGSTGTFYATGRPYQMAFYLGFALHLKSDGIDPNDWRACRGAADVVRQRVKTEFGQTPSLARNIVLHLLFPEYFEDTASDDQKQRMFRAIAAEAGVSLDTDIDEGILEIRQYLARKLGNDQFSFYDPEVRQLWDSGYSLPEPKGPQAPAPQIPNTPPSDFSALAQAVNHRESFLAEIADLLLTKRQLIFEGPPGSGKTFVAEKIARWFTGQPVNDDVPLDKHVEIVQFHQSYGYEDFVQGIRPETNDDGQLVYRVRDGIFLDMVERARANPDDRFVLIIDEINRGNLSRIFGELLLLLEYRGQRVRLPYGSGDAAYLSIPGNLYIIGTMNTADRSLAQIDYALRRRFYFVRFMPVENGRAEVFENWLERNVADPGDRSRLADIFIRLNHGIHQHLGTDDLQIGHSYLMQEGIETPVVFDRVWNRAVRPLLEEYLHHHRNRDEILADLLAVVESQGHGSGEVTDDADATAPEDV